MKPTHLLAAAIITALILACLAAPAAAFSGAGSGTQSDPYIITNNAEWLEISNDLSAHYKFGNDISITSLFTTSVSSMFAGTIDGAGFTLDASGVTLSSNIIITSSTAVFENIHLSNIIHNYNPGPAVFISGGGIIRNCMFSNINLIGKQDVYLLAGPNIENCIMHASSYQISFGYETNNIYRYTSPLLGGNSYYLSKGYIINTVVVDTSITPYSPGSRDLQYALGIPDYTITNCYNDVSGTAIQSDYGGTTITATQYNSESWWKTTMSAWDWENVWQWNDETNLPELRNANNQAVPPTITSISATPATGGQLTEYTLSAIATTEAAGGITGYQWSYSTDSGNTWQPIAGATAATYVWTPGTSISGTVLLKCYITGADGGTVDSYEAGYANIQITVYPPPDISTISVSRPLQKVNTPTTLTATLAESEPATYQWYYSTNGGTTWQPISGATALTAEYTPTTTGTHSVKIVVTNSFGESNELTTNFAVLPTYTPTAITNTSVDISIDSTAKYQGIQQFTLSAELKALNYYTPTLAYLAHDNALYYLDSAEREVIPVSTTTGGTISAAYVGQNTGIITDTSGNTAFYSYQTNDWQYIEQNSASIIASTSSYAATVSSSTLRIYNLNGNLVASTATTAANLAGNDQTNVFVSYSGATLTYYWVNGNSISSASQTITHSITELHQISGTNNFIISTTANTIIVEITDAGVYSLVATSETDTPLIHTQSTSINIFIGVAAPNEIFIIGADGETDGTYVTGSTLSDASIAKATGLYAIAGGADNQAYILSKSTSSTWQLQQVVSFGEAIDYSQISLTGTYAAVSTGLKLYLLEAVDVSAGTYMLNGIIINSAGKPYGGKMISLNGDQIRTDLNGKFLYPVQPNTLYTIIADGYETEYTATNAALQQIAIRLPVNPLATEVDYSVEYSAEAEAILMTYTDSAGRTTAVNWEVRETETNTIVATYSGNTASFPVGVEDSYTNYYVKLNADRGQTSVTKSWSITPAGGYPVDLYGLDDNGKNIIFGFLLLIIAGLFGVLHSRSGAVLVAFAACIMRYLELITIPWIVILIAAVIAIIAAIAGGNR